MIQYLAIMPYSWGKATTPTEAAKIAAKEGGHGRKRTPRIVYTFDDAKTPTCFVSSYGQLSWKGEKPTEVERIK